MVLLNIRIASIFVLVVFMVSISVHGQDQKSGVVTYRIGHYETVHSSKLNEERRLLVHLPDDYETSSNKYPVLYVLDGEGTHRFIRSISAITFYSGARRMPKMIVVGILNTDRTRDITPRKVVQQENSGGGDAFLEFIASELISYIERKYRSAQYRILFGGSSAGMFTIYTLFSKPELFDAYIASRPALSSIDDYTWDSDVIFRKARRLLTGRSSLKKVLYIDYGGQEDALHDPASIHKLSAMLERAAPPDFCWEIRKMGESGYRSAESLKDGLLSIFDGWYYPADSLYNSGFKGIENHAKGLSERFGYSINVTDLLAQIDLNMFGYRFLEHGNPGEAISLFKYAVNNYPGSWGAYVRLAEAYMKNGDTGLAIKNYKKSLELNPDNEYAKQMLRKLTKKE
jgi:predicted alpha/beta superfamily hydrolase